MPSTEDDTQVKRGGLVEQNDRQGQIGEDRESACVGIHLDQSEAGWPQDDSQDDKDERRCEVPPPDQAGDHGIAEHQNGEDEGYLGVHSPLPPQGLRAADPRPYAWSIFACATKAGWSSPRTASPRQARPSDTWTWPWRSCAPPAPQWPTW